MMNESACVSEKISLNCQTILFKNIPQQSRLFLDFQENSQKLNKFYPAKQTDLKDFAEKVLANYKINRDELCDTLTDINKSFGASKKTLENIKLLREKNCLAITTGQQAGLFSNALYTIYKALSTVKFAEDLRKQNIRAVPVFWIAEEDHDFDEVKKTFEIDKEGNLAKFENTPENYAENFPVGLVKFDKTINETRENLFENLPRTEFTDKIKQLLSETYQAGETYSTAFAKFLAEIFKQYGLIFVSPLNEKLKKLCAPIFIEAVEKSDEIISTLLERSKELESKKYQPQVLVAEDSFPFFFQNKNGERQALRQNSDSQKIKVQNSKKEFSKIEFLEIAKNNPQNLSPNALLRPVAQDYLLPTLVYFGGAAEIAYFAQNSVIYKILNRPVTPIRHRASLTIIEAKHRRTLEKYNLEFTDLFKGKENILAEIVEKFLSSKTARIFAEVEEAINTQLNRLDKSLIKTEPTLSANLANRRKKIIWHVNALRKKYHRAEILKDEIVYRRIENLFTALLPHNALQERAINVLTFLNLYGTNFIDWIYDAVETDEKGHQILYL
ncbi:MAG: bacillithiol biosynthesis cysteine-adding enzyme BshC [Acidobacteria bacterium]|jgi:bacillithiol biosynthesis cysteine-adding enzyme BshC|nr:bacillithiol biosynthesis cysteine-adding enzyme BshC [Acidobacteriota bacterium]